MMENNSKAEENADLITIATATIYYDSIEEHQAREQIQSLEGLAAQQTVDPGELQQSKKPPSSSSELNLDDLVGDLEAKAVEVISTERQIK